MYDNVKIITIPALIQAEETPLILAVSNTEVKLEMIRNLLMNGEQNLGHRKKVNVQLYYSLVHITLLNKIILILAMHKLKWSK